MTMASLSILRTTGLAKPTWLVVMLGLAVLLGSGVVHAESWIDGIVSFYYTDPFWFWIIVLGIVTMVLVIIFALTHLISNLNDIRNETALNNAQIEAIRANTNATAQLTTAITNAINVNTTMYQREVDHRMHIEDRYVDLYERLVNHTIYFQDRLLDLYAMQLVNNDVRQLMSDRVKATVVQSTNPPTIETYRVQMSTTGPLPQGQQQAPTTTPTK